jgi:hypothetical protein
MATRSKRKRKAEIRDQKEAKKFVTIVAVSTLLLLILLYFVYQGS